MTSKIKVDNINKVSDDSNIINKCGTTITLGASGDSIALASGASQTGFGRTGTVDWQTGSIKTTTFTAANGEGYFANTNGGAFTMNLPAGVAGAIVSVADYGDNFGTNGLTIAANGSDKINGVTSSPILNVNGESVTLVFVDSTEGWITVNASSENIVGSPFLIASGGTETTCGDYKIHSFTGPGTFTVSQVSCTAADNTVSYLVVAGGGAGGLGVSNSGGGGGAGGFREFRAPVSGCYSVSPLNGSTPITVTATSFPIIVGAGGAGQAAPTPGDQGGPGGVSTFSTVTSAGGGGGGSQNSPTCGAGANGGSGGGSAYNGSGSSGGTGNTPPVSPPQGNPGGNNTIPGGQQASTGGGGATAAATPVPQNPPSVPDRGSAGGAGASTSITGASVARGGGGGSNMSDDTGRPGGTGGGGAGGSNGTVNTGGGGGGGSKNAPNPSASGGGGSGIIVIRYKYK
jgi:hypothetical protein